MQQLDNTFETESTCGLRPALSVGRRKEVLALVSVYVQALAPFVDIGRVFVNEMFHRLVHGDPSKLTPNSQTNILADIFDRLANRADNFNLGFLLNAIGLFRCSPKAEVADRVPRVGNIRQQGR